jgi:hypothetical protein
MMVEIQAPEANGTPTPTPTASNCDSEAYPHAQRQSSPAASPDAVAAGNVTGDQAIGSARPSGTPKSTPCIPRQGTLYRMPESHCH